MGDGVCLLLDMHTLSKGHGHAPFKGIPPAPFPSNPMQPHECNAVSAAGGAPPVCFSDHHLKQLRQFRTLRPNRIPVHQRIWIW